MDLHGLEVPSTPQPLLAKRRGMTLDSGSRRLEATGNMLRTCHAVCTFLVLVKVGEGGPVGSQHVNLTDSEASRAKHLKSKLN